MRKGVDGWRGRWRWWRIPSPKESEGKINPWLAVSAALAGSLIFAALYCLSLYVQYGQVTTLNVLVGSALSVFVASLLSVLYFIPNERWARLVAPNFGFVAVVSMVVSYFFWRWYAGSRDAEPASDFYTTTAQILPVLLLAALIDARQTRNANRWQAASYFAVIGIGEFEALLASAFDVRVRSAITFAQVAAAVTGAMAGLMCALLTREERPEQVSGD
jgi:hypothetical protein